MPPLSKQETVWETIMVHGILFGVLLIILFSGMNIIPMVSLIEQREDVNSTQEIIFIIMWLFKTIIY